jgi:hypothetical protein
MHESTLVPIALFVCVTYAVKAFIDARMRYQLLKGGGGSEDLIRSVLIGEEQQRRHASLRWGIVLIAIAIGFGAIEFFRWTEITPGAIAVLAAVTGLGNLAFFAISRRVG